MQYLCNQELLSVQRSCAVLRDQSPYFLHTKYAVLYNEVVQLLVISVHEVCSNQELFLHTKCAGMHKSTLNYMIYKN